jgi:apolipoprotein D and lipocalin family protein
MPKPTAALCTALFAVSALLAGCASAPGALPPLRTVERLDTARYMGRWYEVARFPHRFERDLVGVTAEYALRPDGRIAVVNGGFRGTLDGKYTEATAVAYIPDPGKPGRLKVSFFRPFYGDYLVFGLDDIDYSWVLVGSDDRKYLWFLARAPAVDEATLALMRSLAEGQGYDLSGLYLVPQRAR